MRRKGVPGACGTWCAIKEKLDKLWNRTIGSIIKINDVTPDGDGSFTIEPGQNVRISETGTGNGIKIDTTGGVSYYTTDDPKLSINNDDLKISTVGVAAQDDLETVAAAEVLDRNDIDDILDGTKSAARATNADSAVLATDAVNAQRATSADSALSAATATDAVNAQYLGSSSANVGSDTKPIKIVNGQAVAVGYDVINAQGGQTINNSLTIDKLKIYTSKSSSNQYYNILETDNTALNVRGRLVLAVLNNGGIELFVERYILSSGARTGSQSLVVLNP